jgi:hypothetical protein
MQLTPDPAFLTGLRNGILLALPLWGVIIGIVWLIVR